MKKQFIIDIISSVFILIFIYTGLSKFFDNDIFRHQSGFAPFLRPYSKIISIALPMLELIVAIMFFFKKTKAVAMKTSLVLMLTFTIYIGWMLLSGIDLPCTCGGIITMLSWKQHLVFNLLLILLASFGIYLQKNNQEGASTHLSRSPLQET